MTRRRSLTQLAQQRLAAIIRPGDYALDATVGNGHDTLFLAQRVGESGHVWGFDVQPAALANTRARLAEQGLCGRVSLVEAGHQELERHLPPTARGRLAAVMFNLGYLPGSDKLITTGAATTLPALAAAVANLRPGGVLSVLAYRGHAGGQSEADAVADWLQNIAADGFRLETETSPGPLLHLLTRLSP